MQLAPRGTAKQDPPEGDVAAPAYPKRCPRCTTRPCGKGPVPGDAPRRPIVSRGHRSGSLRRCAGGRAQPAVAPLQLRDFEYSRNAEMGRRRPGRGTLRGATERPQAATAFSHAGTMGRNEFPLAGLAPEASLPLHAGIRKSWHLGEYAILSLLWARALAGPGARWQARHIGGALCVSVLVAIVDESHQAFVPSRGASVTDVGIDTLGAVLGLGSRRLTVRHRNGS